MAVDRIVCDNAGCRKEITSGSFAIQVNSILILKPGTMLPPTEGTPSLYRPYHFCHLFCFRSSEIATGRARPETTQGSSFS